MAWATRTQVGALEAITGIAWSQTHIIYLTILFQRYAQVSIAKSSQKTLILPENMAIPPKDSIVEAEHEENKKQDTVQESNVDAITQRSLLRNLDYSMMPVFLSYTLSTTVSDHHYLPLSSF